MKRLLLSGTVLLAFGCSDVTRPDRSDTYAFAIDCGLEGVCTQAAGDLQIVFRWPREALPVRVWVAPGTDLFAHVRNAILVWERVGLYGEFRAGFVRDSADADIVVLPGSPVTIPGGVGPDGAAPLDCLGNTTIGVFDTDTSAALVPGIQLPFRVTISPRSGQNRTDLSSCFEAVVAHEFGHALGLFLESDNPDDLMFGRPRRAEPSLRDRATFTQLYHRQPTVVLPAGR